MNENITSIVVNGKVLGVKNGCVLVICGHGNDAGAFWKKIEECTAADFAAAKETDVVAGWGITPWGDSLDDEAAKTSTEQDEYKHSFDKAVDLLAHCKGEDFLKLTRYAKAHNNTFFHCVKEFADCVNADDAYCSAIIQLTRPLGEVVERKTFELFENAINKSGLYEKNFLDMWKALQTISYFCD